MSSTAPVDIQFLGYYQLENLRRQQSKFLLVALAEAGSEIPAHPLLKMDLVLPAQTAAGKIQSHVADGGWPLWWPIVLISRDGTADRGVGAALAAHGFINIFSYRDGWASIENETKIPL